MLSWSGPTNACLSHTLQRACRVPGKGAIARRPFDVVVVRRWDARFRRCPGSSAAMQQLFDPHSATARFCTGGCACSVPARGYRCDFTAASVTCTGDSARFCMLHLNSSKTLIFKCVHHSKLSFTSTHASSTNCTSLTQRTASLAWRSISVPRWTPAWRPG